jgi:hypothetical protein
VILSPFSQLVTHEIITPDYFETVSAYAVSQGEMSQAEAENYFNLNNYLWQSAIGALVMGVFTSAIVAIFVRKK